MSGFFYIKSFGCKVNQCDGDDLDRRLVSMGLTRTSDPAAAQLCVVNGCTVTATADSKCMKLLRSLRRANPDAHTVLTGCSAVQVNGKPVDPSTADSFILCRDTDAWREVVESLREPTESRKVAPDAHVARTRAFVKVQDGCNAFCSYCIVPHVRGRSQSVPLDVIFRDVGRALDRGCKEIVLTGTQLGDYGADLEDAWSLATLIAEIDRRYHVPRIRLSSIEPGDLDDDLFETFSRVGAIQHHVHIPLQSGDPDVLHSMNRPYRPDAFMATVERLRALWPNVGITTDVLVGFPGETQTAFANTVRLVADIGFSRLHVFRFSPRPGTRAASMSGRVPSGDLRDRSRHMIELGDRLAAEFAAGQIGTTVEVLVEGRHDARSGHLVGLTGNYLTAIVPEATDSMINCIVPVHVQETDGAKLICEPRVLSPLPLGEG